jgi:hypothetical protein
LFVIVQLKKYSLKPFSQINWDLVGSTYRRFCIKFPPNKMKGERYIPNTPSLLFARNVEILYRISHTFLQRNNSLCLLVSEEKIFCFIYFNLPETRIAHGDHERYIPNTPSLLFLTEEEEEYFIDQLRAHKGHSNYNDWQYGIQTYNVHNNNKPYTCSLKSGCG